MRDMVAKLSRYVTVVSERSWRYVSLSDTTMLQEILHVTYTSRLGTRVEGLQPSIPERDENLYSPIPQFASAVHLQLANAIDATESFTKLGAGLLNQRIQGWVE